MPNITEWKKEKIKSFVYAKESKNDPLDERMTFISDNEAIRRDQVEGFRIWYTGDGNELLNYYTNQEIKGFNKNPIYNRNQRNYFWGLSSEECNIKRVHSGLPHAIIETLTAIVGYPEINESTGIWKEIEEANDFRTKLMEQGRPLTLAEGYGAWKININAKLSKYPIIEYYEAKNIDYIVDSGIIVGIIFQTYYTIEGKNYILFETRYKANGNSYIDYDLFTLGQNEYISPADLSIIGLSKEDELVIEGLDEIMAVPSKYFYNALYNDYGKSIFTGKIDLFDMIDEIWSQASQTNRVSTPITFINPDVMSRGANGEIGIPPQYNRQFIMSQGIPNGEGNTNTDIFTDQPELNYEKYGILANDIFNLCLTGVMSPASMGVDLSKRDNADAQREKEKVTIMTRNNIISSETIMIRKIVKVANGLYEYTVNGTITENQEKANIVYSEFASPSLESKLQSLGTAWANGEISTERYVELLWGNSLTDEEKKEEIKWLDENRQQETDFMNMIDSGEEDENRIREDGSIPSGVEEETTEPNE